MAKAKAAAVATEAQAKPKAKAREIKAKVKATVVRQEKHNRRPGKRPKPNLIHPEQHVQCLQEAVHAHMVMTASTSTDKQGAARLLAGLLHSPPDRTYPCQTLFH